MKNHCLFFQALDTTAALHQHASRQEIMGGFVSRFTLLSLTVLRVSLYGWMGGMHLRGSSEIEPSGRLKELPRSSQGEEGRNSRSWALRLLRRFLLSALYSKQESREPIRICIRDHTL